MPRQRANVPGLDTEGSAPPVQDEITPHKAKYLAYLQSPEWRKKREAALERAGRRCQLCFSAQRLHVHHRTYSNLFREAPADLTVLCAPCHGKHHGITDNAPEPAKRNGKPQRRAIKGVSLPVHCPFCGALAGEPCRRSSGKARGRVHALRIRLADTGHVPPHKPKVRTAGPRPNRPKSRSGWQGETLDYLAAVPGAVSRHVADRFKISPAQANGRLSHLEHTGCAIKVSGGWYAVGVGGDLIRQPAVPGWRPKNAVY